MESFIPPHQWQKGAAALITSSSRDGRTCQAIARAAGCAAHLPTQTCQAVVPAGGLSLRYYMFRFGQRPAGLHQRKALSLTKLSADDEQEGNNDGQNCYSSFHRSTF